MKFSFKKAGWLCWLPVAALLFNGCASEPTPQNDIHTDVAHLHVGDTLTVTYDGPPTPIPPHEESIKEDGTITLTDIGPIRAAGKTLGELQHDIYTNYVPKYYNYLNISVTTTSERVYYVNGEVNHAGEQLYRDSMTVTRAITAAGDFNDFANHKKVLLIRANGQRIKVNCDKVLTGDEVDPPVYPGDQVWVPHRWF